ncbi:MAG: hypothetical protein ACYDBJ_00915 [Aggregatilineales bacterium]
MYTIFRLRLIKVAAIISACLTLSGLPIGVYAALAARPALQSNEMGSCTVFPPDNPWNTDISGYPVDLNSNNYIANMAPSTQLHPDFGSNLSYGIPYVVVSGTQEKVEIDFTDYGDESDPGPYPFPANAPVEGAGAPGDMHVIAVDKDNCKLYETFNSVYIGPGWTASSGAVFDLRSDALRPDYWTSADAAGLPIFAGLVRYSEVVAGAINHAIRVTFNNVQKGFIHPATHEVGSSNTNYPPMGLRLRLKASFDISGFNPTAQVILTAFKRYGLFVADIGSDWYFTGAPDPRWDDNALNQLKMVPGSAFEVVQTGPIIH